MVQYFENGDVAVFDNLSFRKDKRTGYYLNSQTHKRLHVYVWEFHNGEVPDGFHVHHKDFDKSNNEPDNLVLMSAKEHLSLHGHSWTDKRYKKQLKVLRENARPKASEWHKSEAGKEWHKKHYERMKESLHQKKEFKCENCGELFTAQDMGQNRFCSNKCRAAYRRKSGVDNETRKCVYCGKEFIANKYSKAKTCSRSCRNYLRWHQIHSQDWDCSCLQHGS